MATGLIKTGQVELGLAPTELAHAVRLQDLQAVLLRSGEAALVAGTVTVADTDITSESKIRLVYKTPGGTVGALFLFSKTAATNFIVNSTSATDTSTFVYEIYE